MIRDAVPGDAAACAAIYAPHVLTGTASFEVEPPSSAEMAARLAKIRDSGWPWLVVEADGAVAGFAYVCQFRDRAAYAHTGETSIYLAVEAQRRGLGGQLLDALIVAAAARGCRQLIAVIGDAAAASVGLHASRGFVHAGVLRGVGHKFERWLDVVYMQRSL